jgi:hypothetical protein
MKGTNTMMLAAALMLMCGPAVAARTIQTKDTKATTPTTTPSTTKSDTKTETKAVLHHEMGTIEAVTDSNLILEHSYKGKEEKTTFVLDSGTKKEGDVAKGDRATVYYHLAKKDRVATEVKVMTPKSKTVAKKS